MGGLLRRGSSKTKRAVREVLRSIGPSPELVADIALLRNQIQVDSGRLDDLVRRVDALAREVESFRVVRDELAVQHIPLSDLSGTVVGLSERVHLHEQELKEVRRKIERIGGSVLDDMALDRRLRSIEDRMSGPVTNVAGSDETPQDRTGT